MMADQRGGHDWQQQHHFHQAHQQQQHHDHYTQLPETTTQYGSAIPPQQNPQQQQYGMEHVDRRMFHNEANGYTPPYAAGGDTLHGLMSPTYQTSQQWPPGSDLSAASTFCPPVGNLPTYPSHHTDDVARLQHTPQDHGLVGSGRQQAPLPSPKHQQGEPTHLDHAQRPPMAPRSATAPVKGSRKSTAMTTGDGSDDSGDDLVPDTFQNDKLAIRGKNKRARIPHTAVERRYRENLNAHLEKLRQTVPNLASRQTQGITSTGQTTIIESARPSKCEILNGAIEHISNLDQENQALRNENKDLRARVDELNRWYSATIGGGGAGGYADPGSMRSGMQP